MILSSINQYLRANQKCTLPEIARSLNINQDIVLAILQRLIVKRRVKVMYDKNACAGCNKCGTTTTEFYIWCSKE